MAVALSVAVAFGLRSSKLLFNLNIFSDVVLTLGIMSTGIALFAFSRYVVEHERYIQFVALAFFVGGCVRVIGILVSDSGILPGVTNVFHFQIAVWYGGRFMFALFLAVGVLLQLFYRNPKSPMIDVLVGATVVLIVSTAMFVGASGHFTTSISTVIGKINPWDGFLAVLFLVSLAGSVLNYLNHTALFNYSLSVALAFFSTSEIVATFNTGLDRLDFPEMTATILLKVLGYLVAAAGSLVDVSHIFREYVVRSQNLKLANEELLKYQLYLEAVPDPVRIVDDSDRTIYVNPSFERNFGYMASEMRGKPITQLYDPADSEKILKYAQLVNEGVKNEFELAVITKLGERKHTLVNSQPLMVNGKRIGRITVFRDITSRKELEKRTQILGNAIANASEAIALTDPQGRLTFLNSAAEELFGYTSEELIGKSLWVLVSPRFGYSKAREIYVETLREGSWKGEVLNQRRDGTEYYISLHTSAIKDSDGNIIALVGIAEDVTEKKWEEKKREIAYRFAQMVASSMTVSQLVHESTRVIAEFLNVPLVAIYQSDERGNTLQLAASVHLSQGLVNLPSFERLTPQSKSLAVQSVFKMQSIVSEDLTETEYSYILDDKFLAGARALISTPLLGSKEVLGVVQLITTSSGYVIKKELEMIEAAAAEISVGLERLRLSQKISQQAEQLKKIFESAYEGIAVVDKLGKVKLINNAARRILGIEKLDLEHPVGLFDAGEVGFSEYSRVYGARKLDGSAMEAGEHPIARAIMEATSVQDSQMLIKHDGWERMLSVSAAPLFDEDGSVDGAVAIFRDITDQKKAEMAILKQNKMLSVVNRIAIAVKDALDIHEILNKSLTRILECESVSGAAIYLLKKESNFLELAASLGFGSSFERNPGASTIPITSDIVMKVMGHSQVEIVDEIHSTNVPFLKSAADDLAESAVLLPVVGTRQQYGLMMLVSRIKSEFTDADVELFMMAARVIGAAVENAELYADILEKTRELEDSYEQLRISKEWVEDANAQLVRANQELEEASRLKSQFLANMSHELRTPLNSIIGFTNLILTDNAEPPTESQREGLEIVLRNAKNLLALINDILDLSKIEAGKLTISPEEFSIEPVIKDAVSTVEPLIGEKPVLLSYEIPDNMPKVYSDSARIKQIILNLLSNACKFTDQGHIKVIARKLEPNFISIAVEDTGSGIPVEYQDMIFEEFRQVDGSNTRKHGGTGLGLAISRRLARMLGGDLTLKSEVGKGSTFTLTIPLQYKSAEKEPGNEQSGVILIPSSIASKGNLVVCIDDDLDVLKLLRNHLKSEGFEFVGVSDSRKAVDTVRNYKPVLVTLDLMMPNKDGWEILQELKADKELKDIPVIIHSIVDDKALAFSLGADSYLVKPIDAEKLISLVRKYAGTGTGNILVVDDNPDFVGFVRDLLNKTGFNVTTASNGAEAIKQLREFVPDLIFLDLLMPEMDGFEVVSKIHEDERLKDVPVVVLTAKDVTNEDITELNSKIKNIVKKEGLTREVILREVNRFIQRKPWKTDKES
ncbi:MAG: PAS domain S-box protein [Candidatus Kryptoniota bacterium]